ncbi:uncharacterized protein LOC118183773 [Stegodyphus dumicola]|uniref:uncharacterized protein LOC118183773 n=1 Tax=Stegodyphus dumicola TaxID=202533 RepID=UPI0015A9472E|nr:uncharacterized protein LOC118183773 [Stegodyphus dumicola]
MANDNKAYIFTDGSKFENGVGCNFVQFENHITTHEWKGHLADSNSVFQAEALALTAAVQDIIEDTGINNATIFSDSASTLYAIQNHMHTSQIIMNLQQMLRLNSSREISIKWVKAHAGILGNEAADQLAKEAANNIAAQELYVPSPPSYLKRLLKDEAARIWQSKWDQSDTGRRTYMFFPKVSTDRTIGIAPLSHYISGHGPFPTYFCRHGISTTNVCVCGNEGTPDHYIYQCPLTSQHHLPTPSSNEEAFYRFTIKNKTTTNKICRILKATT